MATLSNATIQSDLRKKLIGNDGDIFNAVLIAATTLVLIFAAAALTGWLAVGMWIVVTVNVLAILLKMAGWKTVVLPMTNKSGLERTTTCRVDSKSKL